MTDGNIDYAKRAIQRKEARNADRVSTMTKEKRLELTCKILADRLALCMHISTHHEQFIRFETHTEWMKYLEDWAEALLETEPRPTRGRGWRFDFYRKQTRYTYFKNCIRAMVRRQIAAINGSPEEGEDEKDPMGLDTGCSDNNSDRDPVRPDVLGGNPARVNGPDA